MGELTSTMRPSHADGLRRKLSNASLTGSATVPSKRFWLAWWIQRCSINGSCACLLTKLQRRRRREGKSNAGDSGRVGAALLGARKRRVGWLESSACTKSTRTYDILGNCAGCVVVDAAADALGHGDHHLGPFAGTDTGKPVARQESVAGATAPIAPIRTRHRRRTSRRELRGCQLVGARDGNLRIC